jgi:hypothetical protein
MRKASTCILLLFLTFTLNEANCQKSNNAIIKGNVIAQSINTPDSFSIKLLSNNLVINIISGFSLNLPFSFSVLSERQYRIIISDLRGNSWMSQLIELKANSVIELSNIKLIGNIRQLDSVIVKTRVQFISEKIDKTIYDVASDPDSKFVPIIDILKKIPSITISGDDEIDISGKGYRVLVNNRKSSLFARNPQQVLRNFPSRLVKSIEIISNPGARYDANFNGAIINIILKKNGIEGYNFSVDPIVNSQGTKSVTATVSTKSKKFGFEGYYSPYFVRSPESFSDTKSFNSESSNKTTFENSSIARYNSRNFTMNNELSYQFDSLNFLSIGYSVSNEKNDRYSTNTTMLKDEFSRPIQSNKIDNSNNRISLLPEIVLNFQRNFKNSEDRVLSINFRNENSDESTRMIQDVTGLLNYPSGTNLFANSEINRENTLQIDYSSLLFKEQFETGLKVINRDGGSITSNKLYNNSSSGSQNQTQNLLFNQTVTSAYIVTESSLASKLMIKYGVRLEYTVNLVDKINRTAFFQVLPSISAFLKVSKKATFKLSYSRKIERPDFSFLNPFVNVINTQLWQFGNPNLGISSANNLESEFLYTAKKGVHRTSLTFQQSSKRIESFQFLDSDSIYKQTYLNLGDYRFVNAGYSFSSRTKGKASHIFRIGGSYREFLQSQILINSGLAYNSSYNFTYKKKNNLQFNLTVGYFSNMPNLQGVVEGRFTNTFGVSKRFLENKLYFAIRLSNFFPEFLTRRTEIQATQFSQFIDNTILQRNIQLNLSFSITKLKEEIKKADKSIENTDRKKVTKDRE